MTRILVPALIEENAEERYEWQKSIRYTFPADLCHSIHSI